MIYGDYHLIRWIIGSLGRFTKTFHGLIIALLFDRAFRCRTRYLAGKSRHLSWLRWWDINGGLLLIGEERANAAKYRAETDKQRADAEKQRADRLTAKLREMGIDPQDI